VKGSTTESPNPCATSWQTDTADDESIVLSIFNPVASSDVQTSERGGSPRASHVLAAQVPRMYHALGCEQVPPGHNKDRTYRGQWLGFDARVLEWQRSDTNVERPVGDPIGDIPNVLDVQQHTHVCGCARRIASYAAAQPPE
jgi:hypothetical protein